MLVVAHIKFGCSTSSSAPTNLMAVVQEDLTSVELSWSPPVLGGTTGYRIYYIGGSSGSEDVSGGSTDNFLLTGLQNGTTYNISIIQTHAPANNVAILRTSLQSHF